MNGQDLSNGKNNNNNNKLLANSAVAKHRRRGSGDNAAAAAEAEARGCTGKSCQSCTAGALADCVAVCCCPCAVVNFFTLTFFKLPWAVARRCVGGGGNGKKGKKNRRRLRRREGMDGICEKAGASEIELPSTLSLSTATATANGDGVVVQNDNFGAEFKVEEVWLEVEHMGFGRVSFTDGVKGN